MSVPYAVVAGDCSPPVVVEAQDSAGNPVDLPTPLEISITSDPSLQFFSDSNCSLSMAVPTVEAAPRAPLYFSSQQAGVFRVTATASGVPPIWQDHSVIPGAPVGVQFASSAQTVAAGACSAPVEVLLVDANGNEAQAAGDVDLTLSSSPNNVRAYSPGCALPNSGTLTIPSGTSRGFFAFRAPMGGSAFVAVTFPGGGSEVQTHVVTGAVRSGSCQLAVTQLSVACAVAPAVTDLSKSVLIFQASSLENTPSNGLVSCTLSDVDAVTCTRNGSGGSARIEWQVVEFPPDWGVHVQRVSAPCADVTTTLNLPVAVNTSEAFILHSQRMTGSTFSGDDFRTTVFTSPTSVASTGTITCDGTLDIQVVEMSGAKVLHGSVVMQGGTAQQSATVASADLSRTFLLYSWRSTSNSTSLCDRMVNGSMPSATQVFFYRVGTGGSCMGAEIEAITYQRVELPVGHRVSAIPTQMTAAEDVTTATLPFAVDVTRSVAFGGGQALNGQGLGAGRYDIDDITAPFVGFHSPSATSLTVRRELAERYADWTSFVVEIDL